MNFRNRPEREYPTWPDPVPARPASSLIIEPLRPTSALSEETLHALQRLQNAVQAATATVDERIRDRANEMADMLEEWVANQQRTREDGDHRG